MDNLNSSQAHDLLTRNDGMIHLTILPSRVGALAFIAAIEWSWFAPGTGAARFFEIRSHEWEGIAWLIVSFPLASLPRVKRLARQLGLRVADGVPTVFMPSGDRRFFPGALLPSGKNNMRLFNVENDTASPIYKNNAKDHAAQRAAEDEIVDLLNRNVRLTPEQIADYIYGSGPFPVSGEAPNG